LHRF